MTIQYQLQKNPMTNEPCSVGIVGQAISIPFAVGNTDYANFKKDILEGAELLDADGNAMDAIQFVKELP